MAACSIFRKMSLSKYLKQRNISIRSLEKINQSYIIIHLDISRT